MKYVLQSAGAVLRNEMAETVEGWVATFEMNYPSDGDEEWIGLILQVGTVKKKTSHQDVYRF